MVLLHTPEEKTALVAPDFELKGTDGQTHTLESCCGENGLAVFFICNHCPYVKAIIERLVITAAQLQKKGIGVVAIMPNDTESYPEDNFEHMKEFARENGFEFPYVIDETQEIARAYGAICTPDLFGFDANLALQYRGRLDSAANQAADETTVPEFFNAMTKVIETGYGPAVQEPSMGCSIKWRS